MAAVDIDAIEAQMKMAALDTLKGYSAEHYGTIKQRKSIATILRNWPYPEPSICVVTDGSRILGLGDLGVNGVGISVSRVLVKQPLRGGRH